MLIAQFALIAAIASLSEAAPASFKHVLHEERETASSDWIKGARIENDAVLPMRIGLTQTNLEKGYDYLSKFLSSVSFRDPWFRAGQGPLLYHIFQHLAQNDCQLHYSANPC